MGRMIDEVDQGIRLLLEVVTNLKTSIWEDNASALALARLEPSQIFPHSKHYAVKYHWFCSIMNKLGLKTSIWKIDMDLQKANII